MFLKWANIVKIRADCQQGMELVSWFKMDTQWLKITGSFMQQQRWYDLIMWGIISVTELIKN